MEQEKDNLATNRRATTGEDEARAERAAVEVAIAAAEREKEARKEVKQTLVHNEQLFAEKCTAIPSDHSVPYVADSAMVGEKREELGTKRETVKSPAPETPAIGAIPSNEDIRNGIMPIPSQAADSLHPGAYAVQTTRFDGSRRTTEAVPPGGDEEQARGSNAEDIGLAEAKPVSEDETYGETLQQARQVNSRANQRPKENEWRKPAFAICYLLSCVILVVVVVSITTGSGNTASKSEEAPGAVLTSIPSNTVVPSTAPPTGILDSIRDQLPRKSQEQLQVFGTPQWLAWEWLSSHPNVTSFPDWKRIQLFSLVTFFYAFEGENWNPLVQTRWKDYAVDECFWFSSGFGFIVSGRYIELAPQLQDPPCDNLGKFTNLALSGLEMSGLNPSIPPEIILLTSLETLLLDGNDLHGNLLHFFPFEYLQELPKLSHISSMANALTGSIPSEIGLLSNSLKTIGLSTFFTQGLTGTLPDSLFLMSNLEHLLLLSNAISGTIPTELGLLTRLATLILTENSFSGHLPTEVGLLTGLSGFSIQSTRVSGTIPTEFGLLEPLIYLDLSFTSLSGTIPSQLGKLSFLEELNMDGAPMLSGSIPTELSKLTGLWAFNLTGNQLTGTIPETFCLLQNESCVRGAYNEQCVLDFDCKPNLCGCDCPCQ